MKTFTSIKQIGDLQQAFAKARYIKQNPFADQAIGHNRTLLLIFFNSSLRTRLSTQKAALNLGMNTIVLDINQGALHTYMESEDLDRVLLEIKQVLYSI